VGTSCALPGRKHRPARGHFGCKTPQPETLRHVYIHRFHAILPEISLMPETGPARVLEKRLPPLAMWFGTRPSFQAGIVSPVLTHADMQGKQRQQHVFMGKKAIWTIPDRSR